MSDSVIPTKKYQFDRSVLIVGYCRNICDRSTISDIINAITKYYAINVIYAYGRNAYGECGFGKKQIDKYTKLKSFSCLIYDEIKIDNIYKNNGSFLVKTIWNELHVCGCNVYNQCGINSDKLSIHFFDTIKNFPFNSLNDNIVISDGISSRHNFIAKNNDIYGFGSNRYHQLYNSWSGPSVKNPTIFFNTNTDFNGINIASIKCGGKHCLFLTSNGYVYSLGTNDVSQCGFDETKKYVSKPCLIAQLKNIKAVNCTLQSSFCLDKTNNLWVFGDNKHGELGINSNEEIKNTPTINKFFSGSDKMIKILKCGFQHCLCITFNHNAYLFGMNGCGQIGNKKYGYSNPVKKPYLHANILLEDGDVGENHSALLSIDNNVYVFGDNTFHQCSINNKNKRIVEPYLLTKNEIGINENTKITKVIAATFTTLIVMQTDLNSLHSF